MPLPRDFHFFFLSFILALITTTLWTKDFDRSRFLSLRIVLISDIDHQPVRCNTKSTNSSFISDWNWPQVMVIDADWKRHSYLIIRACGIEKIGSSGCHVVITCLFYPIRLHPAIRWERRLTKDVVLSGYKVPSGVSTLANDAFNWAWFSPKKYLYNLVQFILLLNSPKFIILLERMLVRYLLLGKLSSQNYGKQLVWRICFGSFCSNNRRKIMPLIKANVISIDSEWA